MAGEYSDRFNIDRLNAVAPLLADHYGLGITYFARHGRLVEDEIELEFPCSYEDFLACFKSERKFINQNGEEKIKKSDLPNAPENKTIIDAIWLIMSVCCLENWEKEMPDEFADYMPVIVEEEWESEEEIQDFLWANYYGWLDEFYDAKARKDLLELYLYSKRKPKGKDDPTALTIKYGKGKSIKLENKDNWFERVLLPNHFQRYLPDINSEEDAVNALNVLNHPGRKLQRPLMYHFIYGTYSMVSAHLGKTAVSESFCELLLKLMEQMDYPTIYAYKGGDKAGKEKEIDTMYIRKMISKLKGDAKKYRFNLDVLLSLDDAAPSLQKSGRDRYSRMG